MGSSMSGGKGGGVSAPDFTKIAQQQAQMSQQAVDKQTQANRADQTNAFGASSNWTKDANGNWTQNSSFGGQLGGALSGLENQAANQSGSTQSARDQSITGAYNQAASRLDPQWQQGQESMNAQLAAQGLDPGSQAAQNQIGNFDRAKNDAYSSAMNNAIQQGNQGVSSYVQSAELPYQQMQALNGLSQQAQTPQAGQAQTPQLLQAAQQQYQAQLQNQSQGQAGKGSTLSGLGSLAGAVGGSMLMPGVGTALGASLGGSLGGMLGGSGQTNNASYTGYQ